ncbi:MAG TPA: DUF945 family protein [Candidatus Binataceae bacterium]|nr:DUF945 family protein [Candidatus Binataceae bacterium]
MVAAACLGAAIVVPALFGRRAERVYRDSIAQLAGAGHAVRLDSYRRGWFSSQATVSVAAGRGAITFVQHVHHGPLGFYSGWRLAFPVAAIVDTDPPPALQSGLDKIFGDAPIVISTVVGMGGVLDTYISRAATERDDPAHKFTANFGGLNLEVRLSQDAYTIHGDAPGMTAAGAFGETGMAGLTIGGESHRHGNGLWLGNGAFNIGRVNYSIVGSGARGPASGLVQDLGFSARTEIQNGRLDVRDTMSVGSVAGRALKLGPVSLVAEIANIPPEPIEQFKSAVASISPSVSDLQARSRMLQEKIVDLFLAIVKAAPVLSIDLHAASPDGQAVGKATLGISPDLANDPLITAGNPDRKGLVAQAWNKYGHATAELVAPAGFLARLTKADRLKQLEQSGILARDGANYVCRASFKDGGWLINGRTIALPAPPPRPNLTNRDS